jgi:FAD binding domain
MPTVSPNVLVVGAGPTGLTLACELLRHGLSVRVLDELTAPVTWSKAAVVHSRTMEIFDAMGVASAILERTRVIHGVSVYAESKRVAHVDFEGVDSPHPGPFGISQHDTEQVLTARLAELGGVVERRKRLEGLTQGDRGVTATVALPDGGAEAIALSATSMLEINYRDSPIVRQDRASAWQSKLLSSPSSELPSLGDWAAFGEGPAPGDRAPDASISPAGKHLFDILRGTRHTLLLFDGAAATEEGYRNLERIGQQVRERHGSLIDVHVVVPSPAPPAALRWDGSVICDGESDVHRRYGARSECLYLVRPDGYVGYRSQPADGERLEAYLATIFTD